MTDAATAAAHAPFIAITQVKSLSEPGMPRPWIIATGHIAYEATCTARHSRCDNILEPFLLRRRKIEPLQ